MNVGFEYLCSAVPTRRKPVEELVNEAGMGPDAIARLHSGGVRSVPVGDGAPLPSLLRRALADLSQHVPHMAARTHAVLFSHSIPIYGVLEEDFFGQCLSDSGLECVPRIAIGGQPCAITHQVVQVAIGRLKHAPIGHGILLLAGDVAYQADDRLYFGAAMGDAAIAGFLTQDDSRQRHRVLASTSHTHIFAWEGEHSPSEAIADFRRLNPSYIRSAIDACVSAAGIDIGDIRFVFPHTPYLQLWDTMAPLLRIPRARIVTDYIGDTGHLNSNDSFVHYLRAHQQGRLSQRDIALLVNPGFGGSRGCTLLEVQHVPV